MTYQATPTPQHSRADLAWAHAASTEPTKAGERANRLRVMLVVHDITAVGGMEVQLAYLATGLAEAGHTVRLVSVRSSRRDDRPDLLLDPRVEVMHLGAVSRLARLGAVPRMAAVARATDVVQCTGWDSTLWGRLAALLARRPVIVADHAGSRQHQRSAKGAPRGRWIALHNRILDRFTATTVICAERRGQRDRTEGAGLSMSTTY